jgi:heat shock protein HslJ
MRHALLHVLCILVFVTTGCTSATPPPIVPPTNPLDGTHWRLKQIFRRTADDIFFDDSLVTHYTLNFGANYTVSGVGDCNQFSGTYRFGLQDTILLTDLQTTLIGCPDPSTEGLYFTGLSQAIEYIVDTDELLVYCPGNDVWQLYFYRF